MSRINADNQTLRSCVSRVHADNQTLCQNYTPNAKGLDVGNQTIGFHFVNQLPLSQAKLSQARLLQLPNTPKVVVDMQVLSDAFRKDRVAWHSMHATL